jgi:hypothetical protein
MKKAVVFWVIVALCAAVCACSTATPSFDTSEYDAEIAALQQQVKDLQNENTLLKEQINKVVDTTTEPTQEDDIVDFISHNLGDSFSLDFVDITIDEAAWHDALYPSDTSSVYSYVSDEENHSFFALCGTMKNTSGAVYCVEEIVAELVFDDTYTYSAYLRADDGGNDFYGDNVNPLGSVKYYIYASIPDELKESYTSCEVRFGFCENFSGSKYDDFEECDYLFSVTLSK